MTLKEFIKLVAQGNGYTYIAIKREDGFEGKSGDTWVNTAMGFSWCSRKGTPQGEDWSLGKMPIKGITVITAHGENIPCAIID